ncbi:ECF transporter S component [Pseudoramibacter sp.]|jgi:uncharacterized membrane protein|uniref:ECF transporter S component n=1 Tax=Pseudoramibacter sp. TaxID=2034862 RepID=UPI0025D3FB09|nr:ECF transporter S component [Pseudoramibacter sp.]MCH4072139.1 ECF transporter S component [Pseudoramibacter sp.]MCH4105909.1 ECF transporter S component [Pseudoramibacter sp.]
MKDDSKSLNPTRQLVYAALFIALSFVGANIKIMGSIAFDSLPAFIAVLVLGAPWGFVIGFLAHMLTAATSGFPLSLPVHLINGVMMGVTMVAFYLSTKALLDHHVNSILAYVIGCIVAVIFNVPIALLATSPLMSLKTAMALVPVLIPAAFANVIIACVIYRFLPKKVQRLTPPGK